MRLIALALVLLAANALASDCERLANDPDALVVCLKAESAKASFPSVPIRPQVEISRVPSAGDGAQGSCPSGGCGASIAAKCAGEWPGDYSMQLYCVKKQSAALSQLGGGSGASGSIESRCASDWPADYSMQAYCRNKQYNAARQLGR